MKNVVNKSRYYGAKTIRMALAVLIYAAILMVVTNIPFVNVIVDFMEELFGSFGTYYTAAAFFVASWKLTVLVMRKFFK